jgi:hypothetical protein
VLCGVDIFAGGQSWQSDRRPRQEQGLMYGKVATRSDAKGACIVGRIYDTQGEITLCQRRCPWPSSAVIR